MYVDRDPAGFGIIGPQQRGGPVGQFDPLDAENAQRPIGDDRARRADLRQLREVDRLGLDPCGPIRFDRGLQGRAQFLGARLALLRGDVETADHVPFEQRPGAREDGLGRDAIPHPAKYVEHRLRRGDGFANVDRINQGIRQIGACLDLGFLHPGDECDIVFGNLALQLFFGRRVGGGIGDHRAHIGQRRLPVLGQRSEADEGRVRAAADVFLLHLRIKVIATAARARFEPPVDQRLRERIHQQAFVIGDRILHRLPLAHHRIGERSRQVGFDHHGGFAHRVIRRNACGRGRVAEVGLRRDIALDVPVTEIFLDQPGQHVRIGVARHRDHGFLRAIPALVEGLDILCRRRLERLLGPDRGALGEHLVVEEQVPALVRDAFVRAAAFALLGQHDRHLGAHVDLVDDRRLDHARKQLERFVELGRVGFGQVQLEHGLRRAGHRVGVVAEGRAEPLPGRDRLAHAEVAGLTEQQVFEQVGVATLGITFVQRTCVDADADRYLIGRHAVLAGGIAQPIVEHAETPLAIHRDIASLVQPRRLAGRLDRGRWARIGGRGGGMLLLGRRICNRLRRFLLRFGRERGGPVRPENRASPEEERQQEGKETRRAGSWVHESSL